jgi:5-methylcytosine-specific restriction endonuclease McrA
MVVLSNGGQLGSPESFCFYCGRSVREVKYQIYQTPPPDQRTRDHVIPACKGGAKLVIACLGCNQDKKDLSLDEYRLIRAFRAGMIPLPEYKFAAEQRI